MGLVAGEQDPLAFLLAQAVGHLAATAFAAIHAFPIAGELPPSFNGAGTSSNPFLKDLKGLLAIVRGRQSSPSSPLKAWIFFAAINSAAASARAFSLRRKSCFSCLISF